MTKRNVRWLASFVVSATTLVAAGGYHLLKTIPIPGDYGWDYLTADTEGRRLYVSHDKEVVVIDLDSGAIIGKVPGSDVHGIAVVREFGRGFISATDPGSVTDLRSENPGRDWQGDALARTPTQFSTIARRNGYSRLTVEVSASAQLTRRPLKLSGLSKTWAAGLSTQCPTMLGTCF